MPFENTRLIVAQVLGLDAAMLTANTPLLGSVAALDSMAVAQLLAALEEHFGFVLDDDALSADTFATVGTLADFVQRQEPA
jgi:acyl carrier protein